MRPDWLSITSGNGLQYQIAHSYQPDAPSTAEEELLLDAIESTIWDWRRLVAGGVQQPHVVEFYFVESIAGIGGVLRTSGLGYSAPSTAFDGSSGDLGVYVRAGPAIQPWEIQTHRIYILRNQDLEAGSENNPLPVGGPDVLRDTIVRCLGMMVTWCGAPATPYARDRLARTCGHTGSGDNPFSYKDQEGAGSCRLWADAGFGADLGDERNDVETATLAWGDRVTERCAEMFKDTYLPAAKRAFTARAAHPSSGCGWPTNQGPEETFRDIYENELGSYEWGTERTVATGSVETGFWQDGHPADGHMYSTTMGVTITHHAAGGLPEGIPKPRMDVRANAPTELARAILRGHYSWRKGVGPFDFYYTDGSDQEGVVDWATWDLKVPADIASWENVSGDRMQLSINADYNSPINYEPDGDFPAHANEITFTAGPFYAHTHYPFEYLAYTRSRIITYSEPIIVPPRGPLLYSELKATPVAPGWRRRDEWRIT